MPPQYGLSTTACRHDSLLFTPSSHAAVAGYKYADARTRLAATCTRTIRDIPSNSVVNKPSTYPAPLVLPEDDLAWEPDCQKQTYRAWNQLKERNKVTPERRTIYFAGPPSIEAGLAYMKEWTRPRHSDSKEKAVPFPTTEEVLDYLKAHYHGLPVKLLPSPALRFTQDAQKIAPKVKGKKKAQQPEKPAIWLSAESSTEAISIGYRATPEGAYSHQLNLNDLLDAAINLLPKDAYALLIMVEHDIFEDEEDDFACGRAYGGSRIAVVSGARYNPVLDADQYIEREHAWPASHCLAYLRECCDGNENINYNRKMPKPALKNREVIDLTEDNDDSTNTAMRAAVVAHNALPSLGKKLSTKLLSGLWLGRVVRTAGHELGHCFGIGHCTL